MTAPLLTGPELTGPELTGPELTIDLSTGTAAPAGAGDAAGPAPVSDIDAWLSEDDVFRADPATSRARRLEAIRAGMAWHVAHNPAYAAYAARAGVRPEDLTEDTLHRVPLLPSGVFKRDQDGVHTGTADAVPTTSSGTLGTVSRVPRDDTTMLRFFASVAAATKELLDVEHSETFVHNVGPRVEESQHLWISYVMAGVCVLHETDFYVRDGEVEAERLIEALRADDPDAPSIVVGPPPLLWDLARACASDPLPVHPRRHLVTIGGWKRREGDRVPRPEFEAAAVAAFGLTGPDRLRDAFNMVELNTVVMECAHGTKHCPPWVYVAARDPHTLAPLGSGETGVLAYVDPTPTSFPGAVLSEDFGSVERDVTCACGIRGDVLTLQRRINRLESRGCAMKI